MLSGLLCLLLWQRLALGLPFYQSSAGENDKDDSASWRAGGHIVLVEDNPTIQQQVRKILTDAGYLVDVVGNGKEALESIDRVRYDLCLMDMFMPVKDGPETTREIRRREVENGYPHLPIIGISAGSDAERDLFRQNGTDDFMPKPINRSALLAIVEKWIGQRRESDDSAGDGEEVGRERNASASSADLDSWQAGQQPIRALLAEDNTANQLAVARLLESEGCIVKCVVDGDQAVQAVEVGLPRMLLLRLGLILTRLLVVGSINTMCRLYSIHATSS
jgi:CheY-like chemotaxis protein